LAGHPLFDLCSDQARIFGKSLSAVALATGDFVFAVGEEARMVTFLTNGVLEYMLGVPDDHDEVLSGRSSMHKDILTEGQWACEAVLWTEWEHIGDLVAVTECQVIAVDSKSFAQAVQGNTLLLKALCKYAVRFLDNLNKYGVEDLTDLNSQMFSPRDAIDPDDFAALGRAAVLEDEALESCLSRCGKSWRSFLWRRRNATKTVPVQDAPLQENGRHDPADDSASLDTASAAATAVERVRSSSSSRSASYTPVAPTR